jgi:hypothetical protein
VTGGPLSVETDLPLSAIANRTGFSHVEYLGFPARFAANPDYCTRESGLARGLAHYEDRPIDLYEAFARYVAFGNRLEISDWAGVLGADGDLQGLRDQTATMLRRP